MATKLGKIVADFSTTLATGIAVGGTSLTLQSIVDDDGNNLPSGNYYFTIDGNNSSKEHIYCTISGASVTAILSVSRQGVTGSGVVRAHRVGAQVVITDFAHIMRINNLFLGVDDLDSTIPLKYDGVADMTGSTNKLATVKYVNDTAIAGAPNASTTTKGITKMSVAPASATAPIAVGDNDPRVPTTAQVGYIPTSDQKDALAGTGTPSSSNKFVTADTDALKELLSHKVTSITGASDINYPSEKSVKTYVDGLTYISAKSGIGDGPTGDGVNPTITHTITHGLGRTPKLIKLVCVSPATGFRSDGTYNSSGNAYIGSRGATPEQSNTQAGEVFNTDVATAIIGNVGATTFDIVWSLSTFSRNHSTSKYNWLAM